jgi:quinol monooxygenase YgiN
MGGTFMALKVFVEYKIVPQKRNQFLTLLSSLVDWLEEKGARNVRFFEGTDQPHLFVEEYEVTDQYHYESIKEERLREVQPFLTDLHQCIEGGKKKVHIWAFRELDCSYINQSRER